MLVRVALVGWAVGALGACGGAAAPPRASPKPPASAAPAAPQLAAPAPEPAAEAAPAEPQESPGFAEAMASLRPSGTEAALASLGAAPASAEPYAQAAIAYATSDAAGMALLWGMTYQAMGGGASDAALARALSQVLVERIVAGPAENGQDVNFSLRLAPGRMPLRQHPDGSLEAPLVHVFEALFGRAVMGFRPPWTVEQFHDAISTWAGTVSVLGTPLDEKVELNRWLVLTAKAGHLEAFCFQLLGSAHPAELKAYKATSSAELKAYKNYLKGAALEPSRAVMPDDLVRVK